MKPAADIARLLKQARLLSSFQRADLVAQIAREYGDGFAQVMKDKFDEQARNNGRQD